MLKVYGTSQLAKYLPGNIFHMAGLQSPGMAAGEPACVLAKSTAWELGLISFSAATFGAFMLDWLAGLLAPGAPAGLGVREMVLFSLLKGLVAEADLLLTIVPSRLVTVAGDMLFTWGRHSSANICPD